MPQVVRVHPKCKEFYKYIHKILNLENIVNTVHNNKRKI